VNKTGMVSPLIIQFNRMKKTSALGLLAFSVLVTKMGVLAGGAGLEQVSEEQGKKDIAPLQNKQKFFP